MFTVQYLGQAGRQPLLSGSTIAVLGETALFRLQAEGAPGAVTVAFTIRNDSARKPLNLEIGTLGPNLVLPITWYNPNARGASGINQPVGIITYGNKGVSFLFTVVYLGTPEGGAPIFQLVFEFFESDYPPPLPQPVGAAQAPAPPAPTPPGPAGGGTP